MDALAQIGKRAAVTPSGTPFGTPAATPAGERANPMEIPGKQSAKKGSKLRQEQSDEEKDDENGPKDLQDATHRIVENLEDAKFADAEQGYDRPLGSSRPALIIVMVSHPARLTEVETDTDPVSILFAIGCCIMVSLMMRAFEPCESLD